VAVTWPRFLAVMLGCAVGGVGVAVLVVAVLSKRVWDRSVG
jgi:uncharacterized membrane protein YccC